MATKFDGKVFQFTQPDGSKLELRGFGDQHHARFETLDGYTVTENPATGYWEIARLTPDGNALEPVPNLATRLDGTSAGVARAVRLPRARAQAIARASVLQAGGRRCEQRRVEKKQAMRALRLAASAGGPLLAPPQRQTVGDFVGLCLLVDFSDAPASIPREEVDRFCNQPGYTGFGNQGSVRDFFLENSIGRCRYSNIVAPYYRASKPKTYYTNEAIPQPQRAIELILEAVSHLKAGGFDFSPLTVDSQGFVYALNFFYAGPVTNNWSKGLWPHSHHLGSPTSVGTGHSLFDYQFTGMGAQLELGTFCHENGHMLCDYPDLYDYGNESSGVGGYCLMCGGNNMNERNPIPISAYLKRLSGWAHSVIPLEHGQTVSLQAGSNDFAIFSKGGREYFLIENRQQVGRDAALPDQGLAIWHVDEDGDNRNEQMTGAQHYELSLEQADGRFDLEHDSAQSGDGTDLYEAPARFADNTVPNSKWWDGTASNLTLEQISAAGATMTFRALLSDGAAQPATLTPSSSPKVAIPDHNTQGISDTINVVQVATIASLKVKVDITHTYVGDLRLTLTTPSGSVIELYPKGRGGNADDLKVTFDEATVPALATLRGRATNGAWRLTVQDLAAADVGQLKSWGLEIGTTPTATQPIDVQEAPGTPIPDFPNPGIERTLSVTTAATVGSVEVSVDLTHTWIGDLKLTLISPAGTSALLQSGVGGSEDNLVRTFTSATAPELSALVGQSAKGTWRLKIADLASADVGKLNSWRLQIKP